MLLNLFPFLQAYNPYLNPYGGNPYAAVPAWVWVLYAAFIILIIAGLWKAFQKAGEPGWAAIVPIYNTYIMLKIAKKPWWWLLLLLIPLVNLVIGVMLYVEFAKQYGKGVGCLLYTSPSPRD